MYLDHYQTTRERFQWGHEYSSTTFLPPLDCKADLIKGLVPVDNQKCSGHLKLKRRIEYSVGYFGNLALHFCQADKTSYSLGTWLEMVSGWICWSWPSLDWHWQIPPGLEMLGIGVQDGYSNVLAPSLKHCIGNCKRFLVYLGQVKVVLLTYLAL